MTETDGDVERYVRRVRNALPPGLVDRDAIVLELRGTIAERAASGEPLWAIIGDLGVPEKLAASYLAEVPLEAPSVWRRAAAKVVDLVCFAAVAWVVGFVLLPMLYMRLPGSSGLGGPIVLGMSTLLLLLLYPAIAEWRWGRTLGKHLLELRVVQESGMRISWRQSLVRQLPWIFQLAWLDAVFALFTAHRQRASEVLSKTRVVLATLALVSLAGCVSISKRGSDRYVEGNGVLIQPDSQRLLLVLDGDHIGWMPVGGYIDQAWSFFADTAIDVARTPLRGRFSVSTMGVGTEILTPDGRLLRLVQVSDAPRPGKGREVVIPVWSSGRTTAQTWVRLADMGQLRRDTLCVPHCYRVRGHTFTISP